MTKGKKRSQPLTSKNICQIYELLHSNGFVSFPLTQDAEHKVESLVSSINSSFGDAVYISTEEKTVAYLYFLIKNHPFTDGNKRTASLAFEVMCSLNNLEPQYSDFTLDELVVFVEGVQEQDHQAVIKMLSGILFNNKDKAV